MAMFIQAEVSKKGHWPNVEVYSVKDFKNMSPSHKRLQRSNAEKRLFSAGAKEFHGDQHWIWIYPY